MSDAFFSNPNINSPYGYPNQHWELDGDGQNWMRTGFCKSVTTAVIAAHGHVLTPGRYVGAEKIEDDGDPFEEKMPRLVAELHAQFAESTKLEFQIRANLKGLGFGVCP
jgi:type I restriction enzyme M protein